MSMERLPVCDVCGNRRRQTCRYRVYRFNDDRSSVNTSRIVDLCSEHAGPLEQFLDRPAKRLSRKAMTFRSVAEMRRAKAPTT